MGSIEPAQGIKNATAGFHRDDRLRGGGSVDGMAGRGTRSARGKRKCFGDIPRCADSDVAARVRHRDADRPLRVLIRVLLDSVASLPESRRVCNECPWTARILIDETGKVPAAGMEVVASLVSRKFAASHHAGEKNYAKSEAVPKVPIYRYRPNSGYPYERWI
jgi:hypothetical protein